MTIEMSKEIYEKEEWNKQQQLYRNNADEIDLMNDKEAMFNTMSFQRTNWGVINMVIRICGTKKKSEIDPKWRNKNIPEIMLEKGETFTKPIAFELEEIARRKKPIVEFDQGESYIKPVVFEMEEIIKTTKNGDRI
jgi:hypothetical protein